jgi:ferric-dicitrate binding protein FerR (iron transport regulator)
MITYQNAIDELDAELDRAADEAHDWIVREAGLDDAGQYAAMQAIYRELAETRARAVERIDAVWARVNAGPDSGMLH